MDILTPANIRFALKDGHSIETIVDLYGLLNTTKTIINCLKSGRLDDVSIEKYEAAAYYLKILTEREHPELWI